MTPSSELKELRGKVVKAGRFVTMKDPHTDQQTAEFVIVFEDGTRLHITCSGHITVEHQQP